MKSTRAFFGPKSETTVEYRGDALATIVGYGSVFYDGTAATEHWILSDMVERVMPGAFDRAIREDDVRALFNHDPNKVLGRKSAGTLRLSVDDKGLRYQIIPADSTISRDVQQFLRRRDVTGSSISLGIRSERFRREGAFDVREIMDIELFDVGPVTFPAFTGTTAELRAEVEADDKYRKYLAERQRLALWLRLEHERTALCSGH